LQHPLSPVSIKVPTPPPGQASQTALASRRFRKLVPANETFQLPGQTDALTEDKQSDEEELSSMSSMHAEKMLQGIRAMKTSSPPPTPQRIDRRTNTSEHLL